MDNNLNNKLNRIDNAIVGMKQKLSLGADASIEEVEAATAFQAKTFWNVFIQENEPEIKDGIWIQTPSQEIDHILVDEDIVNINEREDDEKYSSAQNVSEKRFIHNGVHYGLAQTYIARYSSDYPQILENSYTFTSLNSEVNDSYFIYFYYQKKFYLIGLKSWIELNPDTMQIKMMPNLPAYVTDYKANLSHYALCGDILYIFNPNGCGQYNFISGLVTAIPSYTDANQGMNPYTLSPVIGDKIYLIGLKNPNAYPTRGLVYNIKTQSYTTNDSLLNAMVTGAGWGNIGNSVVLNGYVYQIQHNNGTWYTGFKMRRINMNTYAVENLDHLINFTGNANILGADSSCTLSVLDNKLFINAAACGNNKVYAISNKTSEYENNSLIISQGKLKSNSYLTVLYPLPILDKGSIVWPVSDVNFYTNEDFLIAPTYYGDGTKWIKFKN